MGASVTHSNQTAFVCIKHHVCTLPHGGWWAGNEYVQWCHENKPPVNQQPSHKPPVTCQQPCHFSFFFLKETM